MKQSGARGIGNAGFLTLLGLVLTLVIIYIIGYITFKLYFKRSLPEENMGKTSSEQGTATSSYQSVLDSAEKQINDINKQQLNRLKQLEGSK